LTRACELDPRVAKYFFQRGLARWNSGHPAQANVDFDQAILLEPGDADALLARAKLNLVLGNNNEAASDLASADRVTPREANMRFEIATTYVQANLLEQAVAQYDQWIAVHPQDSKLADAFNRRCWALALSGKQLERALEDCETAIKLSHDSADYLDSRGLVRLRLGQYKESIADYDEALKRQPGSAWSHYGRGVAKLRSGLTDEGAKDIAAATAIRPSIADEARRNGIGP